MFVKMRFLLAFLRARVLAGPAVGLAINPTRVSWPIVDYFHREEPLGIAYPERLQLAGPVVWAIRETLVPTIAAAVRRVGNQL
jgi:hypothetical protein